MHADIQQTRLSRRRLINSLQALLLLGSMLLLFVLIGYLLTGLEGLIGMAVFGALLLIISIKYTPIIILQLYQARPILKDEIPGLRQIVFELAKRAKLETTPELYYVPSSTMNAFAVGNKDKSSIGLTDGLLHTLTGRELVGVLAHEISHIAHNDIQVMGIADMLSRMTSLLSTVGQLLLFINLPILMLGGVMIPWLAILMMIFAPALISLLQLALSRTREFDADLNAVNLTGDPEGLANALFKMEYGKAGLFEWLFLPGHSTTEASLLRTHPTTEERILRLKSLLKPEQHAVIFPELYEQLKLYEQLTLPIHINRVKRKPRWRMGGLWY